MNSLRIAENVIKRAFRHKKQLLILILLPIIIIGMMTKLIDEQGTKRVSQVGYVNLDHGVMGASLIDYLKSHVNADFIELSKKDLATIQGQKVNVTLHIPEDFSQGISEPQMGNVTLQSTESIPVYEALKAETNHYMTSLYVIDKLADTSVIPHFLTSMEDTKPANAPITNDDLEADTPSVGYEGLLISIGFITIFMMMLILITMDTLIEDKKRLTLARIFSHPVKEWEVVTGNLLGSLSLGMLQLIPILITLKIVFGIPWGNVFIGMAIILLAFLIMTTLLGIGLIGIIKNNFNPLLIITTVVIPTSILGGTFIPASMMPDTINKIAYIVPQKWVMASLTKILGGEPLHAVLLHIGVILLFGLAFATFGTHSLKPLND
ncbi:ABC transporter permease [Vallitalea pronyensis]|uniref:ABC transporter permease n=1 Tax=Vallitalea pronyensis TaxID=1348613 RepID=A0A8J8SIE8_9FIRM|nr:ABC transporter permease [Vallitalea pronyensis]QUI24433.1 ABC transporter permease [Vallitalea pronyensis]